MQVERDQAVSKRSGQLLMTIGIIHATFAIIRFSVPLSGIVADGAWNTTGDNDERGFATWFLYAGIGFILIGLLTNHMERRSMPLPAALGWILLGWAALGVIVSPASGFWLLFVPSALIILQTQPTRRDT